MLQSVGDEAELDNVAMHDKFQANIEKWGKTFPVSENTPGPWLKERTKNHIFCIGCWVCEKKSACFSSWGMFQIVSTSQLQGCHIRKHHNSKMHREAVKLLLGSEPLDLAGAPTKEEYKELVDTLNLLPRADEIGGSHKRRAMLYTLKESRLDIDRKALRAMKSGCLSQDARNGRLLIHFNASCVGLKRHRCFMGYTRLDGTDAFDIVKNTEQCLQRFCTPRVNPPHYGKIRADHDHESAELDLCLQQCITEKTTLTCTDAAADELRAGRLLSGRAISQIVSPVFKNLKHHLRDPTHASGRFLKIWNADPFMGAVFDFFVGARGSITNLIQHSPDIQRIFQTQMQNIESCSVKGPKVRNLMFNKPRFNSSQAPLSRTVLFLEALWATAIWVVTVRSGSAKGPDGHSPDTDAQFFLEECNVERYLMAAMMGDGSEENLSLTRFFDNPGLQGYDLAIVPAELHKFITIIHHLFVSGDPGCLKAGYTAYAIDFVLKRQLVAVLPKKVITFGGVDSLTVDVLRNCLSKMAGWVRLSIECIDLEFPHWKTFLSFGIFDLSSSSGKVGFHDEFQEECFHRLGLAFEVNSENLKSQFNAYAPFARHHFKSKGGKSGFTKSIDAWSAAVCSVKRRSHDSACLLQILHHFQAWDAATTSVVEQAFSSIAQCHSKTRSRLNDATETDEAKVAD